MTPNDTFSAANGTPPDGFMTHLLSYPMTREDIQNLAALCGMAKIGAEACDEYFLAACLQRDANLLHVAAEEANQ